MGGEREVEGLSSGAQWYSQQFLANQVVLQWVNLKMPGCDSPVIPGTNRATPAMLRASDISSTSWGGKEEDHGSRGLNWVTAYSAFALTPILYPQCPRDAYAP